MKNVYIGKTSITGKGLAICKVIDSDIATGNAIVYNRETDSIETITLTEKHTLQINIKNLLKIQRMSTQRKRKQLLKDIPHKIPLMSL